MKNCLSDAYDELNATFEGILSKHEQALRKARRERGPGVSIPLDLKRLRYGLYKNTARKVGDGFMRGFSEIIIPNVGIISEKGRMSLLGLLVKHLNVTDGQRGWDPCFIDGPISTGKREPINEIIRPMQILSHKVHTEYHRILDIEIGKHNLKIESSRSKENERNLWQERKNSTPATHFPKHRIVKEGVDKMLVRLRSERPSATLDEAKHIYASQESLSYSNVNKAYHYRPKKG